MTRKKILIMAGGTGKRFWPVSRKDLPKQFLKLFNDNSMIQVTVSRIARYFDIRDIYIITSQEYYDIVCEQLPHIPKENILFEPYGRDTAACVGYATVHIQKKCDNSIITVIPSDQMINNENEFILSIKQSVDFVSKNDVIVAHGVNPTYPSTNYGYIKYNKKISEDIYTVDRFLEKPNYKLACNLMLNKFYLWNCGIYTFRASTILEEYAKYMPKLFSLLGKVKSRLDIGSDSYRIEELYYQLEKKSIDFGIIEYSNKLCVNLCNYSWEDLGNWKSIGRMNNLDDNSNYCNTKFVSLCSNNNIIQTNKELVATVGVTDIILVETSDAILLCHKDEDKQLKNLLLEIESLYPEYL